MPQRLLTPPRWLVRHVRDHPMRLAVAAVVILLFSLAILGFALSTSYDTAREGRIQACRSVNELSRKIYVFLGDVGVPDHERDKFLPSENCEAIP